MILFTSNLIVLNIRKIYVIEWVNKNSHPFITLKTWGIYSQGV